jgi:hypothetical protein
MMMMARGASRIRNAITGEYLSNVLPSAGHFSFLDVFRAKIDVLDFSPMIGRTSKVRASCASVLCFSCSRLACASHILLPHTSDCRLGAHIARIKSCESKVFDNYSI